MNIGSRIKLARTRSGLSQRALASAVNVSATAISKFERGLANPRPAVLLRLARALDVRTDFFFSEPTVHECTPTYRKHSTLGKKVQQTLQAHVLESMERYIEIESIFPEGFFHQAELPTITARTPDEAEAAAAITRQAWSLGTDAIEDLCARIERSVVRVIPVDGPSGFDGFSGWVDDEHPVIAYAMEQVGDRQRFSLAHELGHLILDTDDKSDIEALADRFAAAFLLPADSVTNQLGQTRRDLSLAELLLLKREYGVSIQAWIRRAYDLAIISEQAYSSLYRRFSARGWRTQEPNGIPREVPQRFHRLVHQALAEDLITPSHAARLLEEAPLTYPRPSTEELQQSAAELAALYHEDKELTESTDANWQDGPELGS